MTFQPSLAGRSILITGAASGIGKATAELFAREGVRLGLIDRNAEVLERVAKPLGASLQAVDLTSPSAAEAVADLCRRLGSVDGIVNSAGIAYSAALPELEFDDWNLVMAVNLTGPYLVCRTALPWLQQAESATIVNVASAQALLPTAPGVSAYAASKAGLIAFTKAIAAELGPNIRANIVAPGLTRTPMAVAVTGDGEPDSNPLVAQYALKRVAEPEEVAAGIHFLTAGSSAFVTGTTLTVDGGRTFH